MEVWNDLNSGESPEHVEKVRSDRLQKLLTEDQKFLLKRACIEEQVSQSFRNSCLDVSQYTCVHMWIEYRGFGSEVNNLISALIFCEHHGLDCVVEDELWNSGRLHSFLQAEPFIHRRCPCGEQCRPMEVRRQKQIATSGWFEIGKHSMSVS